MGKTRNLIALLLTLSLTALTACGRQEDIETEGEITAATEEQAVVVEEPAAPEPRELTVAPTEENVRLVSRTFEEDGVTWLAQSGSAVECEVTATHAQVQIVGDDTVENEPSLRPRFAVLSLRSHRLCRRVWYGRASQRDHAAEECRQACGGHSNSAGFLGRC